MTTKIKKSVNKKSISKKCVNKKNKSSKFVTSLSLISLLSVVSASNSFAEFDPATVKMGGIDIIPVVSISESYDSNILYSESAKKSDMITRLNPEVTASMESGANKHSLNVGVSVGKYSKSSEDDFVDSNIAINIHESITRKMTLDVEAKRINQHEDRGSNYSEKEESNPLAEPDKFHINQVKANFSYGSRDSIGRIVLNGYANSRAFDTRRGSTYTRDLKSIGAGVIFFYHFMPKTSLLFELSHRELDYENSATDSSIEQRVLAGARWDISSLTSGTAKAGLLEKRFIDGTKSDTSTFSWEIGARWTPLTYSTFDAITKGSIEESTTINDDYIDSKTILVKWTHFWNKFIDTTVDLNVTSDTFQPSGRTDDYKNAGIKVKYNFRRWLDVAVAYRYAEKVSAETNVGYDKNIFSLSFIVGL